MAEHYAINSTVTMPWDTNDASGASITRATDGSIRIYKGASTTQRSSANGITDAEDFDSTTGCHMLSIDTSDNTDAGFYETGNIYHVMLAGSAIDGQTVNKWLGSFALGEIISNVTTIANNAITAAAIATGAIDADAIADNAIDAGAIATGAITNAKIAADAIGASELATDAVAEIVDAVWDELLSGHTTTGSAGEALNDTSAAGIAADVIASIGSTSVVVTSPVADGGTISIVAGDSYADADGRALEWSEGSGWPDLSGATVTLYTSDWNEACTATGTTPSQVVKCEPSATETAALGSGTHSYQLRATLSGGNVVTLVEGIIIVSPQLAGA